MYNFFFCFEIYVSLLVACSLLVARSLLEVVASRALMSSSVTLSVFVAFSSSAFAIEIEKKFRSLLLTCVGYTTR